MDVGIIGTGAMGSGIAANILKAGHTARIWDRTPEKTSGLVKQGAKRVERPQDAFGGDAVVTMLSDDNAIRAVLIEPGVLAQAKNQAKNTVHIVSATISVEFAKELEAAHKHHGVAYAAAPVLGRPDIAAAGKLNVLAAGEQAAVEKVRPVLDAFGKTWTIGDEPHQANAMKLACNFMLAAAVEAMSEGAAFVKRHDIAPQTFIELITRTLFAAPVYKTYGPIVASHQFEPAGFPLGYALKDVRLALAAAENAGAPMPFAAILRDTLIDAVAHGAANKDLGALAEVAWRRAGLNGG
jgi:3-hydroxyisobutyrate dehydrogenase-like beta-hydroxyacid dehydrogenase